MSDRNLISASPAFYRAVEIMREFDPPIMTMIMFAALTWSDERCKQARADGDLPGNDAALSQQRNLN
jgi:hypothetical protein